MFCDANGKILADIVIPFQRIDEGFARICRMIGVEIPLPRVNVSRVPVAGSAAPELPAALLVEMRAFYAEDYALLDRLAEHNVAAFDRLQKSRV